MAVATKRIKRENPESALILRFLGTTSESGTIIRTLHNICAQICRINGAREDEIPKVCVTLYSNQEFSPFRLILLIHLECA